MDKNTNNEKLTKVGINWYPGHMLKAKKEIQSQLKLIDIVIEILDARIPISSRNPDIDDIVKDKKRIVILNKFDLADSEENKKWIQYFKEKDIPCVLVNSIDGKGIKDVVNLVYELNKEKKDKLAKSGIVNNAIKLVIVGIPNVGKSSFINKLVNKSIAKVGNRPGVTRQNQWIRVNKDILLLDTPGVLWPKFEENIGLSLCFAGCIKDEVIDIETIGYKLIEILCKNSKNIKMIYSRYKIEEDFIFDTIIELIDKIGQKRGALMAGGNIDYTKVGHLILDEFQTGKIGKITLERTEDIIV